MKNIQIETHMGHMRQIAQNKMVNSNAKISKIILKELKGLTSSAKRQKSLYWKKLHFQLYIIYKTYRKSRKIKKLTLK